VERVTESDQCSWCGSSVPADPHGVCPVCGKRGRIKKTLVEIVAVRDGPFPNFKPQSNACLACGVALAIDYAGACPNCGALAQVQKSHTTQFIDLNAPGMLSRSGEGTASSSFFSGSRVLFVFGAMLVGFYVARWTGALVGLVASLIGLWLYRWFANRA